MSYGMAVKNWSFYVVSWNANMSILNWFQIKFLLPLENTPIIYNSVWQYVGGKTGGEGGSSKIGSLISLVFPPTTIASKKIT